MHQSSLTYVRWLSALASLLFFPLEASAQFRVAGRVGVELEPWRRWEFGLSERVVYGDRVPDTGRYQTQLEASYGVTNFLRLGAGYRIGFSEGFDRVAARHRLHIEGRLHTRWRFLRFAYRLRWQNAFEPLPMLLDFDSSLRNRASIYARLPIPLEFEAHAELYSQLETPQRALDHFRVEAGISAHVWRMEINGTYRYDTPILRDGHPYHMAILSVLFKWEAPRQRAPGERRHRRRQQNEAAPTTPTEATTPAVPSPTPQQEPTTPAAPTS